MQNSRPDTTPRIAVSACLLGEAVRYDGTDKRDGSICGELADQYELVPVCPEVGAGLGVPRPPVHLTGEREAPRALGVEDDSLDVTAPLQAYIDTLLDELDGVDGAILKARSPSCGLAVPVRDAGGRPHPGMGLFARALAARRPDLPLADEADLADPERRQVFLARVQAHARRRQGAGGA